ncbi:MAG: hypothetical protein PUD55_02700 [Firmicutes bacterium]|nr:hypothetical protein [Bacillota bacterium]
MIDLKYNQTMPRDFVKLMLKCGIKPCRAESAIGAIKNSILTVGIFQDNDLIAFGRIIGDKYLYLVICDIMVDPKYTGRNLELAIIKELEHFIREASTPDTTVLAKVDASVGRILARIGYKYFDEDYQVVMKK